MSGQASGHQRLQARLPASTVLVRDGRWANLSHRNRPNLKQPVSPTPSARALPGACCSRQVRPHRTELGLLCKLASPCKGHTSFPLWQSLFLKSDTVSKVGEGNLRSRWADGTELAHSSFRPSLAMQVSAASSCSCHGDFALVHISVCGCGGRGLKGGFGEAVKQPTWCHWVAHLAGGQSCMDGWGCGHVEGAVFLALCFPWSLHVTPLPRPV